MSGANFARNSSLTYNEVNTQKTLIYDLRSELSNLKNQFSRLISKPTDLAPKSKVDLKTTTKSRYSHVDSDTSLHESQISVSSQCQIPCKSTQLAPRLNFARPDNNSEHKNSQPFQRLSHIYRKNSNHEPVTITNLPAPTEPERKLVEIKKSDGDSTPTSSVKKSPEFTTFYKKFHGSAYEAGEKVSASSKLSNKTTQISSDAMNQSAYLDQLGAAEEKIKKLEQQNKEYVNKYNNCAQQISDMSLKITRMEKQLQTQKSESARKSESIGKLQEQVKQLTLKLGKGNQRIAEITRQQNKQMEMLKQTHANDLKNYHKDLEKRLAAEKKSSDSKYENSISSLKQLYEAKIAETCQQNEKLKIELSASSLKLDKIKTEMLDLERKKTNLEAQLEETSSQSTKLKQQIKISLVKQSELEIRTKEKQVERKQVGINAIEQKKQPEFVKPTSPTGSQMNQTNFESQEKQKQLQEKLANYLNNIDKQSQKIKEQKADLQKNQRVIEEGNRVICEKQLVIRNLMRDCKAMEKDLIDHRRVRKELELLVEEANSSLSQLHLSKLNNKYKDL